MARFNFLLRPLFINRQSEALALQDQQRKPSPDTESKRDHFKLRTFDSYRNRKSHFTSFLAIETIKSCIFAIPFNRSLCAPMRNVLYSHLLLLQMKAHFVGTQQQQQQQINIKTQICNRIRGQFFVLLSFFFGLVFFVRHTTSRSVCVSKIHTVWFIKLRNPVADLFLCVCVAQTTVGLEFDFVIRMSLLCCVAMMADQWFFSRYGKCVCYIYAHCSLILSQLVFS